MSEFEIWNELGNIYHCSGAYDQAIRNYQKVIELNPGYSKAYCNLAFIYVSQGRYAEAVPMFHKGIEFISDEALNEASLWKQLGDAYRKLEDYVNAAASYRKAIELCPEDAIFQKELAEVEPASQIPAPDPITDDDLKTNLFLISEPSKEDSHEIEVNSTSETTLLESGYDEEIEPPAERLSENKKKNASSEPGNVCWVFKNNQPAIRLEQRTSSEAETSPVLLGGRILSSTPIKKADPDDINSPENGKKPEEGISEVPDKAVSQDTESMDTPDPDAKPSIIEITKLDGSTFASPQGYLRLGILHWHKGEYERAIQFLKAAIDTSGMSKNQYLEALSFNAIALVETDLGKIEEAIRAYQSAANLAPEHIFPWNNLGNLNCMIDRYEDAQAAFQEAIEHDPKDPVGWNGLGDVYHKLGRYEDSIAAYQLGNVFEKQNSNKDALKEFEMLIDSDQQNPLVWNEAGDIYYAAGTYDDAIVAYRKAVDLDPTNPNYQLNLVKAELALERVNSNSARPICEPLAEVNLKATPQLVSQDEEPTSPMVEEINKANLDSSKANQAKEDTIDHGDPYNLPEVIPNHEPEPAYWMFDSVRVPGNSQQPMTRSGPTVSKTALITVNPVQASAKHTRVEQALPASHVLKDTSQDPINVLVQLSPRPAKLAKTDAVISTPFVRYSPEGASVEMEPGSHKASSNTKESRSDAPLRQTPGLGNQGPDQSSLDLQTIENDIYAYRRVTEINPKNDRAWDSLGNMYETVGLHSEAIAAFEQAIALCPQKEAYHYHLGIALAYQKEYEKAIQALKKVVALNPDYVLAHCALAGYYRRLGMEAEAQEHILAAQPSMENESEYNQACFESISGNADRAFALLEIALEKQQFQPAMVRNDPDLDFIRTDPRFESLILSNRIINL